MFGRDDPRKALNEAMYVTALRAEGGGEGAGPKVGANPLIDRLHIKSTSQSSAECSDTVLRENSTTRLVFRPLLVDNPSNSQAAVKGTFIFQRKGPQDEWIDVDTIPLSKLKKGDAYKLALSSAEVLTFYRSLSDLYEVHAQAGIPRGEHDFVPVSRQLAEIVRLDPRDLEGILAADRAVGSDLLARLLAWAARAEEPAAFVEHLISLSPASLRTLNIAVNLRTLRSAIELWQSNRGNSGEDFWQRSLAENSFVLEHVFSWPTTIVQGKAYVGGKSVMNTGGNIIDFLMTNRITRNAALIEIKTPTSPLLSAREYRAGIHAPSAELAGALMQVLNYRHSLQQEYNSLVGRPPAAFDSFEPRCAVVIGDAHSELNSEDKRKSFELFRNQFVGVTIITYDELFSRAEQLLCVLESPAVESPPDDEDLPL